MTTSFEHLTAGAERLGISTVRLVIFQGGESHEHVMPVADLIAFASRLRSGVASAVNATDLHGKIDPAEWAKTFLNIANSLPSEDYKVFGSSWFQLLLYEIR